MDTAELVAASPALPPTSRTNWATNVVYSTPVLHEVASVSELQSLLQASPQLTPAGTGHSFNLIADSLHARVSLRRLDQVLEMDPSAGTVTVAAGIQYSQLCEYLQSRGCALRNLASLTELSVAGAVSTAAHGSGDRNGCLATAVVGVELAKADGEILQLARHTHADIFPGVVVGLGALGVLTKLTLEVQPAFTVRQFVYEDLPLQELTENFDAVMSAGYSVSLFTDWQDQKVYQVWIKIREGDPRFSPAPASFFGATLSPRATNLIRGAPPSQCTPQLGSPGPWHERLPHFRRGGLPLAGDELQSEYFVPRRHATAAIRAVERLRGLLAPPLLLESEIRTVAADDLWLSMCHGRDSAAIHFVWRKSRGAAVRALLPVLERELAPFDPRPHWGKMFAMAPEDVQAKYEKVEAFRDLGRKWDPEGKCRNAFHNTYVFAEGTSTRKQTERRA